MILALVKTMRPKQWVKNIFVFAPLVFALKFQDPTAWVLSALAALAFICASSAVYIINDICDREADKKHPDKKHRPIASGKVSVTMGVFTVMFMLSLSLLFAGLLPQASIVVLVSYLVMNLAYSHGIKHIAILDVLVIAIGFVMRVLMGGYAINVEISPWIILATFLLALFLGFGKRRHELRLEKTTIRESLEYYNRELLDKLINVSCAAALICYAMYAVDMAQHVGKIELVYTTVFVAFGLFRYLQFIYFDKKGGEPERIIYSDSWFVGNGILWLIVTLWILT